MPERKHKLLKRVDASEVQFEGAWVDIRSLTLGELTELEDELGEDRKPGQMGRAMLKRSVRAWNWMDDDGNPLPQPQEDPNVIERGLSQPEVEWLFSVVGTSKEAEKN